MRVSQLWHWLYVRGVSDFDDMANVSKDLRETAEGAFHHRPAGDRRGADLQRRHPQMAAALSAARRRPPGRDRDRLYSRGRPRHAVHFQPGRLHAHLLLLPHRHAALVRNLTAEEILAQLLLARDRLGDFPDRDTPQGAIVPAEGRKVSNIVMMGMGEPLYNFDSVKTALLIATDGDGLSLSKRRITLSTSGVVPEIFRTGEEIGVMLAISLHAVRDDLRDMLVPINKKYPLKELIDACRAYPGLSNARRITFEYVMLKDVNDSLADAKELVQAAEGHSGQDQPDPVQSVAGHELPVLRLGDRSRSSPISSTAPAMPRRSARRAAATSLPPAAS